jgi:hypothetical protein
VVVVCLTGVVSHEFVGADDSDGVAEDTSEKPAAPDDKSSPVPKLSEDELPPATAPQPDPLKDHYVRPPVVVKVDEFIEPRFGQPYVPEIRVLEDYLAEYFRRAGHTVVTDVKKDSADGDSAEAEEASYVVSGSFLAKYDKVLKFRGKEFAIKYLAEASIEVFDSSGKLVLRAEVNDLPAEAIIPEASKEAGSLLDDPRKKGQAARPQEYHAVIDLRRKAAMSLWRQIFHRKGPFGDGEISLLIDSLKEEDPEAEEEQHADVVLNKLVSRRFDAVPYLLEALSDTSPVVVPANYPDLKPANANKLAVYHLADKALEEIFQKISRMGLETPDRHRFVIIRGWENEWRRFCRAYRESPKNPALHRPKILGKQDRASPAPTSGTPKASDG